VTTFVNATPHKVWNFTIALGGGTNCWFAQTPRFHPSDFRLNSLYGRGIDWPISYDDLDPYYFEAEVRMAVSGSPAMAAVLPRKAPFPLPPHNVTTVDRLMMKAQPQRHFPIATARASVNTATRSQCCSTARCNLCPINAKFNFDNGFRRMLDESKVEVRTGCEVTHFDAQRDRISSVLYEVGGQMRRASADFFVLGANAIHSPAILLRSGLDHPKTGRGLHEQVGYYAEAQVRGVQNFDGSTITTGLNYSLYDGDFRRRHGLGSISKIAGRSGPQ
jgi:choline dehydrogenase-like flavoprotein